MLRFLLFWITLLLGTSVLAQPAENPILVTLDGVRWQEVFNGADSSGIGLGPFFCSPVATSGVTATGEQKNGLVLFQNQIAATLAQLLGFTFTTNHPVCAPIGSITGAKR